jgi:predicted transcriptional regulator
MKFGLQLLAKKSISNSLILLISLIFAFILAFPVTNLIFEFDSIDPDPPEPVKRDPPIPTSPESVDPTAFIFLIMIAPVFSILIFIKAGSQFAFKRILSNENRKKIIHQIFSYPGIHYSELLRTTEFQPGQLQWHLNKLLENNIIRKDKIEHFTVYFPTNMKTPVNLDYLLLKKSKLTFTILNHIKQNSGIYQNKISHELNLKRNTVKYHIDKLLQKKFISSVRIGRKKHLYLLEQTKFSVEIN